MSRTGAALKVTEADIERTCSELLEWEGWRALKTDPCSDRKRGKGFGEIGMADCLYIRYMKTSMCLAEVLWIEWKSRHGKPSHIQLDWHARERARGGLTFIAGVDFPASIEGFREWYAQSGLQRRK